MTTRAPEALVEAIDRLVRAGFAVTTRVLADAPGTDLTVQQWRVLVLVAEGDGLRVGEVAARVGVSQPSASRLVRRMEGAGLVRQDPDPADRRASLVRATPHGGRVATAVLRRRRALIADALREIALPEGDVAAAILGVSRRLDRLA